MGKSGKDFMGDLGRFCVAIYTTLQEDCCDMYNTGETFGNTAERAQDGL